MPAKLIITDGNLKVDLLKLNLMDWTPSAPTVKNEGVWMDSSLSDGRRLVQKKFGNVVDTFEFSPSGYGQNVAMEDVRTLGQLLEKAVSYFTSEWQVEMVWIEAQMSCETESVKALIYDYRTPGLDNPFHPPFANVDGLSTIEDFTLILEHSMWCDVAPGSEVCVAISSQSPVYTSDEPLANGDDVYITEPANTISDNTELLIGTDTGNTIYDFGVRFRACNIPANAKIIKAYAVFIASTSTTGLSPSAILYGERNITPAVFSTYANFKARVKTVANSLWYNIPNVVAGTAYPTPDLTAIVQEIVDLPGWASGNDIVLFAEDNTGFSRRSRRFASFNNVVYSPPVLFVQYIAPTTTQPVGHEPTCNPWVYVPNHFQQAQLTHVFYYDASTATFSGNRIGAAKPTALLPNPVQTGDIIYFIIDQNAINSGPFDNLIFNIDPAWVNAGGAMVWEYLNNPAGPTFATLTTKDNTDFLQNTGVNSVHWEKPRGTAVGTYWQIGTINGVTGWIIRLRMTNVIAAPTPPSQADLELFTSNSAFALVDEGVIKGDRFSPVHIRAINVSDGSGYLTEPDHKIKSLMVSSRSTSRGAQFNPFVNLSTLQLLNGQTCASTSALATFNVAPEAPTGQALLFAPVAVTPSTNIGYILFNDQLAQEYKGVFHLFSRCRIVTGNDGDFTLQIRISSNGIPLYTTDALTVSQSEVISILDYGIVELPPSFALYKTAPPKDLRFEFSVTNSNGAPPGGLYIYDVILMPTDEFSGEYIDPINNQDVSWLGTYGLTSRLLDIDPLTVPKVPIAAILREYTGDFPYLLRWVEIQPEFPFLQTEAEQKLFFLSRGYDVPNDVYTSEMGINLSIQLYANNRYFWFKGEDL